MKSKFSDIEKDYKRLLSLHQKIFDLKDPEIDLASQSDSVCRFPSRNISSVKMVHHPFEIAICLPPKCGTTNWQKAMNVLEKKSQHEPPPSGEKNWKPEDFKPGHIYNILRNVDISISHSKDLATIIEWKKILNTRQGYKMMFYPLLR